MNSKPLMLIDGGLATELTKKGFRLDTDPLWSARLLYTQPSAIVEVHESYLDAGAEVIESASYQSSIEGFVKYLNVSVSESEELIKKSVRLCQQAREQFYAKRKANPFECSEHEDVLVAGSVGPYGAMLADGSEYNGNYVDNMSIEELKTWHRPRVSCLVRAGCDLLAFETMPSVKEGIAMMQLLKEFPGVKAWLSFSCEFPTQTAHKENFSTAIKSCLQNSSAEQLVAIGMNCCPPDYVTSLAKEAVPHVGTLPIIAYPNSGETFSSGIGWDGEPKPLHKYVKEWAGIVQWFGGCCRTSPQEISEIKRELEETTLTSP